ncbi:ferritin-like domain-containing protein, partial [Burkholderia pseudomallei]
MNPNTVPPAERDVVWIKHAVQTAIELEYSTLQLYLSAMFSLEVQN